MPRSAAARRNRTAVNEQRLYRLVLVDDEWEIREKLRRLIEESGTRFEIVGEYENGVEAYEGILSVQPELVVTDIRIPYVDGLETMRRVAEVMPLVKCVVTTGFDEFDYAKQAANLGVIGFINKPIDRGEMREMLLKAQAQLDREFSISENIQQLEEQHAKSLPVLRENDLCRLVTMAEVEDSFRRKLLAEGVDLNRRCALIAVLEPRGGPEDEIVEAFTAIRLAFEEPEPDTRICPIFQSHVFLRSEQLFVLLLSDDRFHLGEIESLFLTLIARIKRRFGKELRAGISEISDISDAADCGDAAVSDGILSSRNVTVGHNFRVLRSQALRALEFRAPMSGGHVFAHGNIAAMNRGVKLDDGVFNDFEYVLRHKDYEESRRRLDDLLRTIAALRPAGSYFYFATGILNRMINVCSDIDALSAAYGSCDEMHRRLFEFASIDEAGDYLHRALQTVKRINEEAIRESVGSNLRRILDYIDLNYPRPDLCLESVSEQTHLSISYINTLLKRENTTFVKYTTNLRMKKAIDLLSDTTAKSKIVEISEMVGYSDPYYFSHCFKKYTGVSPKEFRSRLGDA